MTQDTSVDNDLQKAIDDITKTTNGDPLFADPVAAPAPAPVGPFPVATPGPMPPAPMPMPEPVDPAEPVSAPEEEIKPGPIGHEEDMEPKAPAADKNEMGINQVKEAALKELVPILDKIDAPAEQKFGICKDVIENYHDTSVIEPAYQAASKIADDKEKAEALLYIIDSIDKM